MYAYQNRLFASALPFAPSFRLSMYTRAVLPGSTLPPATSAFTSVLSGNVSAGFAAATDFVVKSGTNFNAFSLSSTQWLTLVLESL